MSKSALRPVAMARQSLLRRRAVAKGRGLQGRGQSHIEPGRIGGLLAQARRRRLDAEAAEALDAVGAMMRARPGYAVAIAIIGIGKRQHGILAIRAR